MRSEEATTDTLVLSRDIDRIFYPFFENRLFEDFREQMAYFRCELRLVAGTSQSVFSGKAGFT